MSNVLDVGESYRAVKIIYGYKKGCLDDIDISKSLIILIEPRTDRIDEIQNTPSDNIILIKKVLVKTNKLEETILYHDKDRDYYFIKDNGLVINGTNLFNVKKYKVYTTSIENIIKDYTVQNIHSFVININIENCSELLQSVESYNHIISRIFINKQITDYHCKILQNFYCEGEIDLNISNFIVFVHKNLNVKLPKIVVYLCPKSNKRLSEMKLFLQQYKMSLITNTLSNDKIIPYPESIEYFITDAKLIGSSCISPKLCYENVIEMLDCIFDQTDLDLDIIIKFNPKYFDSKNTLQIMYPLQDNVLYINKALDIIYGTKNCMFMLYQILKSKYFTDYIEEKMQEKRSLFKIFSKRYFYDYISKIFVIKDI